MSKIKTKNQERRPVNLYLKQESIRQLEMLQKAMMRPSKSNALEVMIADAFKEQKVAA